MTQPQDPSITLALPLTAVNYLLTVLQERPLKEVRGLVGSIEQQAQAAVDELNERAAQVVTKEVAASDAAA